MKESKCAEPFIGAIPLSSANALCHQMYLTEWGQWALDYPELAQAYARVK